MDVRKKSPYLTDILIVDDTSENLYVLSDMLKTRGYTARPVPSGKLALQAMRIQPPDLVLLDISMPDMNGYEVCRAIKADEKLKDVPVIFISAMSETFDKVKAFSAGGVDYITKPFQIDEVYARIETHLELRQLQKELERTVQNLEERIQEQVQEISESQMATIFALAKLAESRDDETGKHLERVRIFCQMLAVHLSKHSEYSSAISSKFIETIYHASPLHDIGKVGIPDSILLKRGKLTLGEFEVMKQHTALGANTLEAVSNQYPNNLIVKIGIEIARHHHEWWDGSGYPDGLAENAIPLSARIMAVADVYDALRSRRVYKSAFTPEETREIIQKSSGTHFDPVIVEAFLELESEIDRIYQQLVDQGDRISGITPLYDHQAMLNPGNILVVDDNPDNLNILAEMLKSRGFLVRPVLNGSAALLAAEMDPPDLIMLDINMEDMDGYEVCRLLKQSEKLKQIPVIFISAFTDTLDIVKAFRVGGVDYVSKPYRFEEVEARITTHLNLHRYQAQIEDWNIQLETKVKEQTSKIQDEISERIKAQTLMEKEKELLTTTLLSIQDGVISTNPEGKITLFNRAAGGITGFKQEEALGKEIDFVLHLLDERTNQPVREAFCCMTGDQHADFGQEPHVLVARDGKRKLITSSAGPVIDRQGSLLGHVFVLNDITEWRMMEVQYSLSQKMESIGQLAAGIAHEINTPMQFVGDNTQFLKVSFAELADLIQAYVHFLEKVKRNELGEGEMDRLNRKAAEVDLDYYLAEVPVAIQQSLEGIDRVRKIVLAMKAFSHPSRQGMQLADINRCIETTATISRNEWKYVADLELDLDPELPLVNCLVDEINQALLNIIINAVQAIDEAIQKEYLTKGKICIRTRAQPNFVTIEIEDSGIGIPAEIQHRIFDPFFTTKEVGKGTGQGLSIVHNVIVKKHSGKIYVTSKRRKGTVFMVHLPVLQESRVQGVEG